MGRPPKAILTQNEILTDLQGAIEKSKAEELVTSNDDNLPPIPCQTDAGWSDFLLGEFDDKEVVIKRDKEQKEIGRYPKVNGLRRIARKYLGEIVRSLPKMLSVNYNLEDGKTACCYQYDVTFKRPGCELMEFGDVGEVIFMGDNGILSNINKSYAKFPSAVAVTRAEARALRKALGLNTVAAEELDNTIQAENGQEVQYINETQKTGLKVFTKRLGIDLDKYIKEGVWLNSEGKPNLYGYSDVNKIQFSDAARMWKQLEAFQRDQKGLDKYKETYKVGAEAPKA